MQPAVIKIKFTPVIRHLQKDDTNCCLEIVPNVSCIQNLDKIKWNNNNRLVEYNVPVTYKIILKRDIDEDTFQKQDKIYYSCIDLRLLSTNSSLACGDISKVISDNYILRNFTTDIETSSALSKSLSDESKKYVCCEEKDDMAVNMLEELHKCLKPTKKQENQVVSSITLPNLQGDVVEDNKLLRTQYTECTVSKETITDVSDIKINKGKKRKLTITSVCTLNTIDNPATGTVYGEAKTNNSKIDFKYESKNKFNISKVTETFAIHRSFYTEASNFRIDNSTGERILPELRVAHLMMTIENEIRPLKILLSEIYKKCVAFGLLWKTNVVQKSAPTFYPRYTDKIKFLNNNQRKSKCNRVVYSIVFEE